MSTKMAYNGKLYKLPFFRKATKDIHFPNIVEFLLKDFLILS